MIMYHTGMHVFFFFFFEINQPVTKKFVSHRFVIVSADKPWSKDGYVYLLVFHLHYPYSNTGKSDASISFLSLPITPAGLEYNVPLSF